MIDTQQLQTEPDALVYMLYIDGHGVSDKPPTITACVRPMGDEDVFWRVDYIPLGKQEETWTVAREIKVTLGPGLVVRIDVTPITPHRP